MAVLCSIGIQDNRWSEPSLPEDVLISLAWIIRLRKEKTEEAAFSGPKGMFSSRGWVSNLLWDFKRQTKVEMRNDWEKTLRGCNVSAEWAEKNAEIRDGEMWMETRMLEGWDGAVDEDEWFVKGLLEDGVEFDERNLVEVEDLGIYWG